MWHLLGYPTTFFFFFFFCFWPSSWWEGNSWVELELPSKGFLLSHWCPCKMSTCLSGAERGESGCCHLLPPPVPGRNTWLWPGKAPGIESAVKHRAHLTPCSSPAQGVPPGAALPEEERWFLGWLLAKSSMSLGFRHQDIPASLAQMSVEAGYFCQVEMKCFAGCLENSAPHLQFFFFFFGQNFHSSLLLLF